jgi:Protein of unknown function (DUF3048) N-terminal domain/Protein of unknown function (DUF3048) C-terminal domain
MPDDTNPEQPGNVPGGSGDEDALAPPSWDTPTQAVPADLTGSVPADVTQAVPADLTGSVPADVTQAVPADLTGSVPADVTPSVPVDSVGAGDGASAAAMATSAGTPTGRGKAVPRAWAIALVTVAVLVLGTGIALAVTSESKTPVAAAPGSPGSPGAAPTAPQGPLCPLTGVPPAAATVPARPALVVKVDNYPQARPWSGVDQADIVFEEPVEGGITRLAAVFQCQGPALIGPIRSARAVDQQILDQLSKPILVHVGDIDPVAAILRNSNLYDFDLRTHGAIVQNVPGRYAPYSTYVSAAAGWGLVPGDATPPAPPFTYSATTPAGPPVTSVHIPFAPTNNTLWTWDAPSGHWLLSYSGTPAHVASGAQIATTNVVVQTVHVTYGPWLENSEGGLEVQSQMTGSGPVTVFRNGVAITGTWKRSSLSDPTTLTASNGTTIALAPGQTWVEIVPSTVAVTTTSPTPAPTTSHP